MSDSVDDRRLRAEREAERIFDMSPALLAVAGLDGYLRRFNPAFEVFGYSREELLSRPWIEFAHPDDVERMAEAAAALERGEPVVSVNNRVVCRDGSVRWVEWSTRVVPEEGLFYAAGRDVTESRHAAEEQAALRRVATLVAQEASPEAVFEAVVREIGEVLGFDAAHMGRYDGDDSVVSVAQWGQYPTVETGTRLPLDGDSLAARVLRTGRPARMDDWDDVPGAIAEKLREIGVRFSIGAPISIEGRPWGIVTATSKRPRPFPAAAEARLHAFTELAATAVSNAAARDKVRALADEQAALRRVATLVAEETAQPELFARIAEEVGGQLGVASIEMLRYEDDRFAVVVAAWGALAPTVPVGTRVPLGGQNVTSVIFRTGRAARLDDYGDSSGPMSELAREGGVRSAVGTPIFAEGRLWGAMIAASLHDADILPTDIEPRIRQFTELMTTAIANAEARLEVARLADEQAALRRVATLVAQGAPPTAVFEAVTREVADHLGATFVALGRFDGDHVTVTATSNTLGDVRVGDSYPVDHTSTSALVWRTGRTARVDDYSEVPGRVGDIARRVDARTVIGAPVIVDRRTWGVLSAVWAGAAAPPEDTEQRLAGFAELLDTAIANADSRDQLTASRARLLAAGDDARRRMVRDLHDGAQQRLVQVIIALKLAHDAIDQNRGDAKPLVLEALEAAEQGMTDVRELAHGILPSILTRGGLRAAVETLVKRLDLADCELDVLSERLAAEIEASAYFIVAEALTNIAKHAEATRVAVRATARENVLTVEVSDDGVGGADPEGHGLVGIADRAEALGGRFHIETGAGAGTVLTAELPLLTQRLRDADEP